MKPRTAMRKAAKWGGAAAFLLLLAAWIGSAWWSVSRSAPDGSLDGYTECGISAGQVYWSHHYLSGRRPPPRPWWDMKPTQRSFRWEFDLSGIRRRPAWASSAIAIPLWFPAAIAIGATAIAWRVDSRARYRARAGMCLRCGYARAGLAPDAACPECGIGP
jgi:hypothetical protein